MALDKVLYTATATATGGRTGSAKSSDLARFGREPRATPKEMGGAGGPGTNPEQLFAAGYSACFIGAIKAVASGMTGAPKISLSGEVSITTDVGIGPIPGGFGIQVAMEDLDPRHGQGRGRGAGRRGAQGVPVFERDAWQH